MKQLQKWLGKKCKWNLCYRASRDGWSAQDFHRQCDNKGPTVVLVKANDYIFGGYTDQNWNSGMYGNLISFLSVSLVMLGMGLLLRSKSKKNLFVSIKMAACMQ